MEIFPMSSKHTRRSFLAIAAAAGLATTQRLSASPNLLPSLDEKAGSVPLNPDWKSQGVLDLRKSPHSKLRTVPVSAVTIRSGFWSPRRVTNVQSSLPTMRQELLDHGRMDNFLRLEGHSSAPQRGPLYSDSDVYKWIEAAAFVLQSQDDPALRKTLKEWIATVVAVQEPSGYLNTFYVEDRRSQRMLPESQVGGHELYCIGHLLQGAIAMYRATGDPTLLNAGIRFVDDFLIPNYGPGPNQKGIVSGHPEIEMALIELYRTTGQQRYLDLAGYILHGDPRVPLKRSQIVYMYCGIPFPSRTKLEGHAVRAMYACCGATDYYLETGDPAYLKTLEALWTDLSQHQLYITGGVGARSDGEAFGEAYELPNARAYGESCAAIGNMMWNWRMLHATGESRFADVMERALYNGINSGMSLDGTLYCYRNPLAFDPSTGDKIRNTWYDTTCCPPNLERTLASLPGYFYSTSKEGIYVHLYDNANLHWHLESGTPLEIEQTTRYPWDGNVRLSVKPGVPEEFTVFLRIPAWSGKSSVTVNGKPVENVTPGQYLALRRRWASNDTIELAFDMRPQVIRANPAVADDTGRVALERGPLVYCMELLDQPAVTPGKQKSRENPVPDAGLALYSAHLGGETTSHFESTLLDGLVVLEHPGKISSPPPAGSLYQTATANQGLSVATSLRLIPYYAWANREPSPMQVWIPASQA
jgi:DUF1680 family protein